MRKIFKILTIAGLFSLLFSFLTFLVLDGLHCAGIAYANAPPPVWVVAWLTFSVVIALVGMLPYAFEALWGLL